MIKAHDLLEPSKVYNSQLKSIHEKNAEDLFDQLAKTSKVNTEENKKTVEEYTKLQNELLQNRRSRKRCSTSRILSIVGIVVLVIVGLVLINLMVEYQVVDLKLLFVILSILGVIGLIIVIVKCCKKIKIYDQKIAALELSTKSKLDLAWSQMNPLNCLFDWNMGASLMSKTCPLIELDSDFNPKRFKFLHDRFGFNECHDQNISTVYAQSGQILGNPFVFQKRYIQEMEQKAYTGSITIHWQTYSVNSKGQRTVINHTQILEATTYHPAPVYYLDTLLVYGNDAAPNLSFSRTPSKANAMSDKEIEKFVRKNEKKLDKMVEDDVGDKDGNGSEFKRMANTKFESLFQAYDRNHETEFRLLFTPLAQKNMVDLITTDEPYGDDFIFVKEKKINIIKSAHMQRFDLSCNPRNFFHYDFESMKRNFINIHNEYFKNIFFDFAPLLSIPLYQQHKPKEYIYKDDYYYNLTSFEHECLANSFQTSRFQHPDTATGVILKSRTATKSSKEDIVTIDAYSFREVPCVEYVNKLGGDGRMHTITINYFEYHPLINSTQMVALYEKDNSQTTTNNDIIKQRGLMAYIK